MSKEALEQVESKYFEGRRRILAQNGNGIIKLSTDSKYFGRKKELQNRKRTERSKIKGPMYLALGEGHEEAAKILARKGADCTEEEKAELGEKYTNFEQIQKREQAARQGQGKSKEEEAKSKG